MRVDDGRAFGPAEITPSGNGGKILRQSLHRKLCAAGARYRCQRLALDAHKGGRSDLSQSKLSARNSCHYARARAAHYICFLPSGDKSLLSRDEIGRRHFWCCIEQTGPGFRCRRRAWHPRYLGDFTLCRPKITADLPIEAKQPGFISPSAIPTLCFQPSSAILPSSRPK